MRRPLSTSAPMRSPTRRLSMIAVYEPTLRPVTPNSLAWFGPLPLRLSETDPTSGFAVTVLDDLGGVQQPGCAAGAGALALMQLAVRLEIFDVSPHTETREADGARGRSLAPEAEWAAGAEWRAERAVAVIAPHHA